MLEHVTAGMRRASPAMARIPAVIHAMRTAIALGTFAAFAGLAFADTIPVPGKPTPPAIEPKPPTIDPGIIERPPHRVDPHFVEPAPRHVDPGLVKKPPPDAAGKTDGKPCARAPGRADQEPCSPPSAHQSD